MAVHLLLGPAGSGKTGCALKIFKRFPPSEHHCSVRFVVPTVSQVIQICRLLLRDPEFPGLLGDPVCTFHKLAADMLARAELERSRQVSDMQKLLMLKEIVRESELGYFDPMRNCRNFPKALGGVIGSLKAAGITPEDFCNAVESAEGKLSERSSRRMLDLAALYQRYQKQGLEARGVCDAENAMWRALEVARANKEVPRQLQCVILDGFPTLTPPQQEFVRLLVEHSCEVIVALEYQEGRPEVFSYVAPTLRFLTELPGTSIQHLPPPEISNQSALGHLKRYLFAAEPPVRDPDGSVTMLVGATRLMEIELVAAEIKRLAREHGYGFEDVAIVAREIASYKQRIIATFREYGIPLVAQSHALSWGALAHVVLLCMKIALCGWRREHVVGVLKSSYLRCDPETCGRIEGAALPRRDGRETWFEEWGPDDGTLESRIKLLAPVAAFADSFARPHSGGAGQLRRAVETLVAGFQLSGSDRLLQEDYAVWKSLQRTMREVEAAEKLLGRSFGPEEFADLLELGTGANRYRVSGGDTRGVRLIEADALRGEKFRAVFVVGLLEKAFPRQERESPFLRRTECEVLNAYLPHKLDLAVGDPIGERYLFYMAASSALERLYLSYPAADADAKVSLPSFYLDEVNALFTRRVDEIARGMSQVVPPVAYAETAKTLVASVVLDCCASVDEQAQAVAAAAYNRLLECGALFPDTFSWMHERESRLSDERILAYLRERGSPLDDIDSLFSDAL